MAEITTTELQIATARVPIGGQERTRKEVCSPLIAGQTVGYVACDLAIGGFRHNKLIPLPIHACSTLLP
ncbi:hypothetical protein Pan97_16280 [Bremerella volcania]|uniref:Uncharacterized protein n=1 Tax=Bremerella volcania TaxID=2527984 RepID=A0A518C5W2_9BACT|nr:hypothetical protein Pan97_16280 [Bremerella volcania]